MSVIKTDTLVKCKVVISMVVDISACIHKFCADLMCRDAVYYVVVAILPSGNVEIKMFVLFELTFR